MKQKPKTRVSPVPPPPAWARREILKLARDSGMMTNRLYDMVIRNGLEATRNLLEEQIQLIASIDNGPVDQTNEVETLPATDKAQEPDQPITMVNRTEQPPPNGVGAGPDIVSERRVEPGENKPDDFLTGLVSGPVGGEENVARETEG